MENDQSLQAAAFINFVVIFSQIINPAKSLSTSYYNIQKGMASADRIQHILEAEIKIIEKENAISIHSFNQSIELRNIGFSHAEGKAVLHNINLTIQKGKMIAIVDLPAPEGPTRAIIFPFCIVRLMLCNTAFPSA